jgi:hypothetical protein
MDTLIPAGAAIVGAVAAVYSRPGPTIVRAIQHFAAGVVFAAAAGELLLLVLEEVPVSGAHARICRDQPEFR